MTRIVAIVILAMVCASVPPGPEAGETAQAQVRADDEETIKRICLERIERFNRLREAPLKADFTPDADFVNVYGMWRKGTAEIERGQKERMETVLKDAKITLIDLRIRFIKPDVAIVHQTHDMSGMLTSNGEKMPPHRELGIRVLVKEQGTWLTRAFHNTIVRPVEPPLRAKW